MNLNSLLAQEEADKITFQDRLSLLFMVIGAIFAAIIILSLALSLLDIQPVEFEGPFM